MEALPLLPPLQSLLRYPEGDNINIPHNKLNKFTIGEISVAATGQKKTGLFYTKPQHGNCIMMSNIDCEYEEHEALWKKAKGDVLITGLGLGFSHCNLVNNPNITSVTIIEKYQDVIDLVWDHCSKDDRFNLIHADANTWEIEGYWDCIWIDHWVLNISEDTIDDFIKSMTTKYSPHCSWLGFWLKERDKHEK